jgi:tetratricopeptide (TPR) repeat protein
VLFLLGLALACGAVRALPDAAETWTELRSENFILVSSAGEATTRRVADWLETFRAVLPLITTNIRIDSKQPTYVFLFRNGTSFDPYKGKEATAVSVYRREGNFIALNSLAYGSWTGKGAPPTRDLYHELTHLLIRNNYALPPLWANEGLAEYYSTFRRSGSKGDIGRAIPSHVAILRGEPWIPLATLVHLQTRPDDARYRKVFYPQCWALVHYLVSSGPELADRFHRYLELADQGLPSGVAFEAEFGADFAALEQQVREHVAWNKFRYARIKVPPRPKSKTSKPRVLPREEILTRLGELQTWTRPEDLASAEAHYRTALNVRPDYPPALLGLGEVLQRRGRSAEAEKSLRRAVELAPADAAGWYALGNSLLLRFLREGGEVAATANEAPPLVAEARRCFAKSVAIEADNGDALAAFGATYTFQGLDHDEGIAALRSAVGHLPARMDFVYNLLVLHLLDDDRAAARRQAAEALKRAPEALVGSVGAAVRGLTNPEIPGAKARRDDWAAVAATIDAELDGAVRDPRRRAELRAALHHIGAVPAPAEDPVRPETGATSGSL